MDNFKVYEKVNSAQKDIGFGISKMENIYTKRNGKPDEPHRHDYYTVLIIKEGKGIHKIDFNTYSLEDHQVYFVAPGQVHQVIEKEMSIGYSIVFSNQFLVENSISLSFIENLNLFKNYGQSPPLVLNGQQFSTIERFVSEIYNLYKGEAPMKYLSIGAFLKLVLIECNNICSINTLEFSGESPASKIIRVFKEEVDQHYKKEHSIGFYADKLFVSPNHLNRTVKTNIGKTAKEYIQARLITEAKRLLYFTELSNKEIAYTLGFDEPANFSAFFKKHTNLSPSAFKRNELMV